WQVSPASIYLDRYTRHIIFRWLESDVREYRGQESIGKRTITSRADLKFASNSRQFW
ncbi:hypothetical protein L249_3773, partial [Ophiocordyceps polyrhachis-furcata BCC 54312]